MKELLRAIAENLDDHLPKLVYSDWLEERGGEANVLQANYIRLNCELKRFRQIAMFLDPERVYPDWLRELHDRHSKNNLAFATAHWDTVSPGFALADEEYVQSLKDRIVTLQKNLKLNYQEERGSRFIGERTDCGLLTGLTGYIKRFVEHAGPFFERHPLRTLKFVDTSAGRCLVPPEVFFDCPAFDFVRDALFKGSRVDSAFIKPMIDSPYVTHLQTLRLYQTLIEPEDFANIIAQMPQLKGIVTTYLPQNVIDSDAFLTDFEIDQSDRGIVTQEAIDILASSNWLGNLNTLRIRGGFEEHQLQFQEVPQVIVPYFPHMTALRTLELSGVRLGQSGLERLIGEARYSRLESLILKRCDIPAQSMAAISRSPLLDTIRELDFRGNPIRQIDVEVLRIRHPHLRIWTDEFFVY